MGCDRTVVDDPEMLVFGCFAGRQKRFVDGIHDDADSFRRALSANELGLVRLVNRDYSIRQVCCKSLNTPQEALDDGGRGAVAESHVEHVRRKVVDVEEQARAEKLREERRRDEKVRRVVNLDHAVASEGDTQTQQERRGGREATVLDDQPAEAAAAAVRKREPTDANAVDDLGVRLARAPNRHDIDIPARRASSTCFPQDPRVEREVPVDDHTEARPLAHDVAPYPEGCRPAARASGPRHARIAQRRGDLTPRAGTDVTEAPGCLPIPWAIG